MANNNVGGPKKPTKLDTVRVKNGQSLGSIAKAHGISLTKLYELNPTLRARRDAGKPVVFNNSIVRLPGTGKYQMGKNQTSSEGGAQRALGRAQAFAARPTVKRATTTTKKTTTPKPASMPLSPTARKTTTATLGKVSGRQAAAYRDQQAVKKRKTNDTAVTKRFNDMQKAASKIKF